MRERIEELTVGLLKELAESGDIKISGDPSRDTDLYGGDGELDSMGLVSLILALEQEIESEFGTPVSLADEKALSQKNSPYRNVKSVADYAAQQLAKDE